MRKRHTQDDPLAVLSDTTCADGADARPTAGARSCGSIVMTVLVALAAAHHDLLPLEIQILHANLQTLPEPHARAVQQAARSEPASVGSASSTRERPRHASAPPARAAAAERAPRPSATAARSPRPSDRERAPTAAPGSASTEQTFRSDRKVRQESPRDPTRPDSRGCRPAMEANVATHPVDVRLLRAQTHAPHAHRLAHDIDQPPTRRQRRRASHEHRSMEGWKRQRACRKETSIPFQATGKEPSYATVR
jgi:hypothetical protein